MITLSGFHCTKYIFFHKLFRILTYLVLVANLGNHLAEGFNVSSKLFDFVLKVKGKLKRINKNHYFLYCRNFLTLRHLQIFNNIDLNEVIGKVVVCSLIVIKTLFIKPTIFQVNVIGLPSKPDPHRRGDRFAEWRLKLTSAMAPNCSGVRVTAIRNEMIRAKE